MAYKLLYYYLEKITSTFTRDHQPLLPWLFDSNGNIPRANKEFNHQLFKRPVELAYLIAAFLLIAKDNNNKINLEIYEEEIAKDLLLCLR